MYPGTGPRDRATRKGINNNGSSSGENDMPTIDAINMNANTEDSSSRSLAELIA